MGFGGQHGYYRDYTGLYLLTHRYYDAGAGRFVSRDPLGYKGGINLYGFAGNNPVNGADPEGTQDPSTYGGVGHLLPPSDYPNPAASVYDGSALEHHDQPSVAAVLMGRASKSAEAEVEGGAKVIRVPKLRNQHLAGKAHPKTGVPFGPNGYPIFDSFHNALLPLNLRGPTISDALQFKSATTDLAKELRQRPQLDLFSVRQLSDIFSGSDTIDGFTWHHHEDGVTLQLVNRSIHAKTGHSGGRAATGGRP